ncbi:PAS-domain containing protein [Tabrizicola sp.]|uniref:hybrid sensor histidine kinase/response regulator n=1 Tax=Tabrizicola sp. TaxID=2005166 RepID=UPI003F3E6161
MRLTETSSARLSNGLLSAEDGPERRNEKLLQIVEVLMRHVEQMGDDHGAAYAHFHRAAMLEDQVRQRTADLATALDLLNDSNAQLGAATREAEMARKNLSNAIETVQEGFALFDPTDVLVMCNSRFGMHMPDILSKLKSGLTFNEYIEMVSQSPYLELGDTQTPLTWAFARRERHRDPHVIFNVRLKYDRWVQVSEQRTADRGTVILQTDVTDLIRLERQERSKLLDDQARMISATLDHISQGVAIFDPQLRIVGWNARLSHLLAIPAGRIRAGQDFDLLLERLGPATRFPGTVTRDALLAWARQTGPRLPLSFELHREDVVLEAFGQEMPDRGFVISFTDITRERATAQAMALANETLEARVAERTNDLEDALKRAERANSSRSRFVAAASHDLLQPLSAAKLFLESVRDEVTESRPADTLAKAQNALQSVESILSALLDISKLELGADEIEVTSVRLLPMLKQLTAEFAPAAARKGIRLTIMPCDLMVRSNPTYLRRIMQNLIGNAIRYTDSGRVLVGLRRLPGAVRLEVHDTGAGIPEKDHRAIFREFHRLNARASASEGMGLGLAIVERACVLLDHPLSLKSEVGHGSTFRVNLGRSSLVRPPEASESTDRVSLADTVSDCLALLVENDIDVARALTLLLEKWGIEVLHASSGEEALSKLDALGITPDFCLIDHQLGDGMTGVETIGALRARNPSIPLRLVTANRSAELQLVCEAMSILVLHKPVSAEALSEFLRLTSGKAHVAEQALLHIPA